MIVLGVPMKVKGFCLCFNTVSWFIKVPSLVFAPTQGVRTCVCTWLRPLLCTVCRVVTGGPGAGDGVESRESRFYECVAALQHRFEGDIDLAEEKGAKSKMEKE
mmetsp:Transcript_11264/g.29726  ORF Transcript_11264/g.29726 Transcript_11264/m.29726 type:complete len:104 (-) Transcript_11264:351-662(-)